MLDTPLNDPRHIFHIAFNHPVYLYPAYKNPLSALEFNPRKRYARIGSIDEQESTLYVETYTLDTDPYSMTQHTMNVDSTTLTAFDWVPFRHSLTLQQATYARDNNIMPHPQLFIPEDDNLVFGPIIAGFSGSNKNVLIFTTYDPDMTQAGYVKNITVSNYLIDTALNPPHCSINNIWEGKLLCH